MKRDGRSLDHKTLEAMRLMALERMAEGEPAALVATWFGMHRTWAHRIWARARGRGRGRRVLLSTKGTGRPRALTRMQERQVFGWINGKNPRQYGFDFGLWTRQIVRELLEQKFSVSLSLASVGTLLARLGLTAQKPLHRAYQRNPEAVARWERETYPAILRQARRDKGEIYFWDESGFRADAVQGKTWGLKGDTPVVSVPAQRQSISAASAVNSKGGFWFALYNGALNADRFVELLRRMMKWRRTPLHLVVEGLPAHKTKAVRAYVDSLKGKLTLYFLPGYAPDLNPDELVWSYTRRTGVTRSQLQASRRGAVARLRCWPHVEGHWMSPGAGSTVLHRYLSVPAAASIQWMCATGRFGVEPRSLYAYPRVIDFRAGPAQFRGKMAPGRGQAIETAAVPVASAESRERLFFLVMAVAITLAVATAFNMLLGAGVSTLRSPWWVHVHAVTVMTFIALHLSQNVPSLMPVAAPLQA